MKLLKYGLLLSAAALLLPAPPPLPGHDQNNQKDASVANMEVFSAVAAAYSDARGFCARQPQTCSTASRAVNHIELRAKYTFKQFYEWANGEKQSGFDVDQKLPPITVVRADPLVTGSTPASPKTRRKSANTLTIEDILPAWRGPAAKRSG